MFQGKKTEILNEESIQLIFSKIFKVKKVYLMSSSVLKLNIIGIRVYFKY